MFLSFRTDGLWANSVDPDQPIVEPPYSNFRVIKANFLGAPNFRMFTADLELTGKQLLKSEKTDR